MTKGGLFSPLVLAIVLLAGFLGYINWPQEQQGSQQGPRATPVKVATAVEQSFPIVIEALGTAIANESVDITAQQDDLVKALAFEDGDVVTKGQLLVQLDDREERARVNELEVNLVEARRQYNRVKNLRAESAASEQLLDEQEARVKALEAQLDVAKSQMQDLRIHAPFSGQLGIREVSVGSLIRPADVITTLDDVSLIKIDFSVSETHLASLKQGQQVTATSVAYEGEKFTGKIATVGSRIDPVTRSVLVRAIINNENGKLRPGMLLQIQLQKQVLQALVIPEKALVPNQDKQFVYVLNGDKVTETEVTIGERRPGYVQITDGLNAGEQIVVDGTLRVRDQSTVKVLNSDGA